MKAFPAHAGMARASRTKEPAAAGVPRPRGDGPSISPALSMAPKRSPPTRGWPDRRDPLAHDARAFPAHAGMARNARRTSAPRASVPRPRGDGPRRTSPGSTPATRSPPTRGWPDADPVAVHTPDAFPAHAGMARRGPPHLPRHARVPRPRGDGPPAGAGSVLSARRSPPTRGWPGAGEFLVVFVVAFPAHAGMARRSGFRGRQGCRVPRPRGDGPEFGGCGKCGAPRSPPTRGWPGHLPVGEEDFEAFPAHAGMARRRRGPSPRRLRVPRPRGDGPPVP